MVVVGVMAMAADMAMVTHIMAMDMAILMDMAMVSPTMDMAHPITHHTQLLPRRHPRQNPSSDNKLSSLLQRNATEGHSRVQGCTRRCATVTSHF